MLWGGRSAFVALVALLGQTVAPSRDQATAVPPPAGTASLAGIVTVAQDGQRTPLRRARVLLQATTGSSETIDTDTNGRFRLDRLPAGSYRVVVDKPGFVPVGRAPVVELKDAQAATVTALMQRGGAIEGRVIGSDGEPAIGLTVSAVRLGFGPYGKKVVAVRQTTTDDLGRYRLHTLTAGDYYIEAAPDPLRAMNAPAAPGQPPKPARTYYSGSPRIEEARVVTVGSGEQVTNLDFTTANAVLANVSARVSASSGRAPASFGLRVQRVGAASGEVRCFYGPAEGPSANTFQCSSVPPGDFWFLVTARATADAAPEFAAARISVDGRDQSNVPITTSPGTPLSGHVEVDGGGPLPPALQVSALETEYEFPSPAPGPAGNTATPPADVAADGSFGFASVAGSRLMRMTRFPEGWALKGVWLGDVEMTDQPLPFAAGDPPRTVRIVITKTTGSIAGAVVATPPQSAAGTRVVVFSEDSRRWGARSRFIRTVEANATGRYSIGGLLPGKYLAIAVDALEDGAWEDPDVLGRLQSRATPFSIASQERVALDLRVR